MLNFHSHLNLLLIMSTGHTFSCYKHNQEMIVLERWVQIQWYTAVDFQGWSKMALKI